MNFNTPITDFLSSVTKKVENGRVLKDAFPSALSLTYEEYTEFQITISASDDLELAATYIAECIKTKFAPYTKYLYWRVRPDASIIDVKVKEDKKFVSREFIKFYTRILITDKEETHENREGVLVRIKKE